jgi:DNA modification methylase
MRMTHEWVFWLAKSVDAYRGYDRVTRSPHKASTLRRIRGPYIQNPDDERYQRRSGQHPLHPEGARPTTVFECAVGGEPGVKHPAKMPLKLARHLVALSAEGGGLVLDPFAGSGTTGVAAIQLGRRFLGLELEAGYLDELRDRLANARRSPLVAEEQMDLLEVGGA